VHPSAEAGIFSLHIIFFFFKEKLQQERVANTSCKVTMNPWRSFVLRDHGYHESKKHETDEGKQPFTHQDPKRI